MQLIKDGNYYVFKCTYDERHHAKEAGFNWNPPKKRWQTKNARVALKLAGYTNDEELRQELMSNAQDTPDPNRGRLTLTQNKKGNIKFLFHSPKWLKQFPKDAGFIFEMEPEPHWYTEDIHAAMKLVKITPTEKLICPPEIITYFENYEIEMKANIEASRASDADIEIPKNPKCEFDYLPYQRGAIAYAKRVIDEGLCKGVLFGDEMGLGKTIMAIGVCNLYKAQSILVVCPASLKLNWQREFNKWGSERLLAGVCTSKHAPSSHIQIANFEILWDSKAQDIKQAYRRKYDVLIVDECHRLKNSKSLRSQAVNKIEADVKLYLTGTPIPNRVEEIWPLVSKLAPHIFKSKGRFLDRYTGAYHNGFGMVTGGAQNLDELQTLMRANFMIRRLKKDVLKELPAKRRQIIELPASPEAQRILAEQWDMWKQYEGWKQSEEYFKLRAALELAKANANRDEYKAIAEKLREAGQIAFQNVAKMRVLVGKAKFKQVAEHLEDLLEDHSKVVVMGWHTEILDSIKAHFGKEAVIVTGATKLEDRQTAVDRFQDVNSGIKLFVGNINAAGVGITLTAANLIVFAELDWVPANMSQAEDRIHRIGQEAEMVLVQHLVLENSLDAKLAKTLIKKQEIADKALDHTTKLELSSATIFETEDEEENDFSLPDAVADISDPDQIRAQAKALSASRLPATSRATPDRLEEIGKALSPYDIVDIHAAISVLAARCDGAATEDNIGFAKPDVYMGKFLGTRPSLTPAQAALALIVCNRYKNTQLQGRELPYEKLKRENKN